MNENSMNNDLTMAGVSERALLARRYRIIRQLGQGGMGSVWLAEDTQLDGKLFAIKMLPSILVANKRAYNQLKAEALLAMKLIHPNIVQIRAFEENDGNPFLVMDYIDGETLDEWLGDRVQELGVRSQESGVREVWPGRSPLCGAKSQEACERPREPLLNVADIVPLFKPIAEALDYAHAEGVVHRDIKPANVMIRKDGRPFIMDFGIAREIQETMTRVTGRMSSGTLMYMSPEQLHGLDPDKSQDIYSFAAMVYECLTGKPPFYRGQIEHQIDHDEPAPLSGDIAIASSVMAGLAKKPDDRPKSCVAVLEGNCEKREKELGVRSQESGDRSQVSGVSSQGLGEGVCERPRQPHQGLFGNIAAIILLVFGLAGGIWYWQGTHENEVVSDSLIPAKPSAKTNPPPPPSGPTKLDVMEIKVETSVQKKRIERIDDSDGFKSRKDELSDLYIKAIGYENAESWRNAAFNFTNYVEGCKALIALDADRIVAKKKKDIAETAKIQAAQADSARYVSVQWKNVLVNIRDAEAKFAAMEFSKAARLYEEAAKLFLECERDAKKECTRLKMEQEKKELALREKERQEAIDARKNALKESKQAEDVGAKQYAVKTWNQIVKKWKMAESLLKEKHFVEAKNKYNEISKAYRECIKETENTKREVEERKKKEEQLRLLQLAEKRKQMQSLQGKWKCETKWTSNGITMKMMYSYDFRADGTYAAITSHLTGYIVNTGTWSQTGSTLILNDSGEIVSYVKVGSETKKNIHKNGPSTVRYNLIWRENGTFELRYSDHHWKIKDNDITAYYDSEGRCHLKCRTSGGFLRKEQNYDVVETAKVFQRYD